MGAQPSKPAETKVFIPRSQVDFSESLLATLESSTETNFTRGQIAERYVEQRVAERLAQLEEDTLKKFETKLDASLLNNTSGTDETDPTKSLSTKLLNDKIDALNKRLSAFEVRQFEKDEKLKILDGNDGARKQLLQCLLDNAGKPLNCYDLIQQFKNTVASNSN
ncbi:hypothetical protein Kpol_385p4 [Vanderwaltozyma polyspora DSM 70294]|uniref:MICOS complex subunit MIC19 n=1 Tax=Vanderwaltozyma polyspora (strain ATCC 22028 / DSM 70294 / BCRC 21397 / CBS 2163 / NBRC 10782 / NRRL Y-8283 / UCD 57-17) TaxID=436907 RepID=A7TS16_VANPO|nr:uncharacterized protein Kpol_385p4 [Vanderwaltozyma polyspora DSM 70294]EDO14935.1 hypothetical protein Kpol_385p4 [Vanderwaltozyma polyspora DSM 70294]